MPRRQLKNAIFLVIFASMVIAIYTVFLSATNSIRSSGLKDLIENMRINSGLNSQDSHRQHPQNHLNSAPQETDQKQENKKHWGKGHTLSSVGSKARKDPKKLTALEDVQAERWLGQSNNEVSETNDGIDLADTGEDNNENEEERDDKVEGNNEEFGENFGEFGQNEDDFLKKHDELRNPHISPRRDINDEEMDQDFGEFGGGHREENFEEDDIISTGDHTHVNPTRVLVDTITGDRSGDKDERLQADNGGTTASAGAENAKTTFSAGAENVKTTVSADSPPHLPQHYTNINQNHHIHKLKSKKDWTRKDDAIIVQRSTSRQKHREKATIENLAENLPKFDNSSPEKKSKSDEARIGENPTKTKHLQRQSQRFPEKNNKGNSDGGGISESGRGPTKFGKENSRAGKNDTRDGRNNTRAGKYNTRAGKYNTRAGRYNTRAGRYNTRTGRYNTRAGRNNTRTGRYNTRAGRNNTRAGKNNKKVARENTKAEGENSKVGRENTEVGGGNTRVLNSKNGWGNVRTGGEDAKVGQGNSIAGRKNTKAGRNNSMAGMKNTKFGRKNTEVDIRNDDSHRHFEPENQHSDKSRGLENTIKGDEINNDKDDTKIKKLKADDAITAGRAGKGKTVDKLVKK